jgi:hypothetical protein
MKIYFHNQYKSAALKSKPRPEEKHFAAEAQSSLRSEYFFRNLLPLRSQRLGGAYPDASFHKKRGNRRGSCSW